MANSATLAPTTVEPIRRTFPAEKAKAWHYKIHPYYTKQPSNVVGKYIRHFCPEGGLVADHSVAAALLPLKHVAENLAESSVLRLK